MGKGKACRRFLTFLCCFSGKTDDCVEDSQPSEVLKQVECPRGDVQVFNNLDNDKICHRCGDENCKAFQECRKQRDRAWLETHSNVQSVPAAQHVHDFAGPSIPQKTKCSSSDISEKVKEDAGENVHISNDDTIVEQNHPTSDVQVSVMPQDGLPLTFTIPDSECGPDNHEHVMKYPTAPELTAKQYLQSAEEQVCPESNVIFGYFQANSTDIDFLTTTAGQRNHWIKFTVLGKQGDEVSTSGGRPPQGLVTIDDELTCISATNLGSVDQKRSDARDYGRAAGRHSVHVKLEFVGLKTILQARPSSTQQTPDPSANVGRGKVTGNLQKSSFGHDSFSMIRHPLSRTVEDNFIPTASANPGGVNMRKRKHAICTTASPTKESKLPGGTQAVIISATTDSEDSSSDEDEFSVEIAHQVPYSQRLSQS